MSTKRICLLLIALWAHSTVEAKKKNIGVPDLNCPLDDDPNDPTHLSVQGDCTKFIKCSYGLAYKLSCPNGLYWSSSSDRCDAKDVAQCDPNLTTPKAVVGGGGCQYDVKRHPTDCSKFIQCANGEDYVINCMEGMFWNQNILRCDFDGSHCQG